MYWSMQEWNDIIGICFKTLQTEEKEREREEGKRGMGKGWEERRGGREEGWKRKKKNSWDKYDKMVTLNLSNGYINFFGCRNTWLQTWGLKTTIMDSLTVLETRSLRSKCQQSHSPSGTLEENPSSPLPAPGGSRFSLACGCQTPISASMVTWPSSLCLCLLFRLLQKHSLFDLGPTK